MKYSEINNLKPPELKKRLDQAKQALFDARMKHKMQRLSNMMDLRNFKKDIARLETAWATLPESAFVSYKKPKEKAEPLKQKKAKETTAKIAFKKKDNKKSAKETILDKSVKTKAPSEKLQPKKAGKQKPLAEQKEQKTPVQDKKTGLAKPKTKKWFGFLLKKKSSSSSQQLGGKRSFFRRKSG